MSQPPLAGRRVLVTRAAHQAGKLSQGLRVLGAEPVEVPVLEIQPPATFDPLDQALQRLDGYQWLILTSANTVRALAGRAQSLGIELAQPPGLKVAAVGQATAEAARKAGFAVAFVPERYVAEALADGMGGRVTGRRVLIAQAEVARDVIPDALRLASGTVDVVHAYRNVMPDAAPAQLRRALQQGIDAATFTSSSSVTHLKDAATAAGLAFPFPGVAAASIGPITTQTLIENNWPPAAEASPSDIPGLIEAMVKFFALTC